MTAAIRQRTRRSPPGIAVEGSMAPLLIGLMFKAALDLLYVLVISPEFSYAGMTTVINVEKMIKSYFILTALLVLLTWLPERASRYLLLSGLYMGVIPLLSMYGLQDRPSDFLYMVIVSFLLSISVTTIPPIAIGTIDIGAHIFTAANVSLAVLLIIWIVTAGGLSYLNFDIFAVYNFRREVGALAKPLIVAYLVEWISNATIVVLLVQSIYHRWWSAFVFAIFTGIFVFSTLAIKGPLFITPFVFALYHVTRNPSANFAVGAFFTSIVAIGALEVAVFGSDDWTSVITRRVFFLPAFLAFTYYDVFGSIGQVYWSNSYIGVFVAYPFGVDPAPLVGEFLKEGSDMWANNGIFGSGFMQAGFAGMLVYGVILGLWLYLIDCIAAKRLPVSVTVACMVGMVTTIFTDSDLPTGLLTHGGLAATLLLWLWAGLKSGRGDLKLGAL